MFLNDLQAQIYGFFASRYKLFLKVWFVAYLVIVVSSAFGTYLFYKSPDLSIWLTAIGKKFGQVAIMLLGAIVLPGILGRFRIEIKITRLITLFRRQLGITVFLLAFAHYYFLRLLPSIENRVLPYKNLAVFEIFGLAAFSIFFFMFLTSNNWSMRVLGRWWKYLHRFIYVALWLLVLHTGIRKISTLTLFIGIFAALEIISWIYYFFNKNKKDAGDASATPADGGGALAKKPV